MSVWNWARSDFDNKIARFERKSFERLIARCAGHLELVHWIDELTLSHEIQRTTSDAKRMAWRHFSARIDLA